MGSPWRQISHPGIHKSLSLVAFGDCVFVCHRVPADLQVGTRDSKRPQYPTQGSGIDRLPTVERRPWSLFTLAKLLYKEGSCDGLTGIAPFVVENGPDVLQELKSYVLLVIPGPTRKLECYRAGSPPPLFPRQVGYR